MSFFRALKEQFLFFFGILFVVPFFGEGIFPAGKATQHFNILLSPLYIDNSSLEQHLLFAKAKNKNNRVF
jgi:hypothetical protein